MLNSIKTAPRSKGEVLLSPNLADLPVAVLGAGPVGLAAAAKLIQRSVPFVVVEAASVGANLLEFGHVRLFSPWRFNVDATMAEMLKGTGWSAPDPDDLPLAKEVVERVLQPFATLSQVSAFIELNTKVVSISRQGTDKMKSEGRGDAPFVIRAIRDGKPVEIRARAVIDCTGTWNTPNPLGASGLSATGEVESSDRIFYGIPDVLGTHRARYEGKRTLVVGSGHSAANALLGLATLAERTSSTRLVWSVRSPSTPRLFGGGASDALPARGELGSSLRRLRDTGALEFVGGLRIEEIRSENGRLTIMGRDLEGEHVRVSAIDEIICAAGQRPNLGITSELRVRVDSSLESAEALAPLIDPNVHSCGTVRPHGRLELAHPEPGFYTAGVKSYGRAPTFLMTTGFEQVRSVVAAIAGDFDAADRVELELPETGVCGLGSSSNGSSGKGCSTPAQAEKVTPVASGCATSGCASGAATLAEQRAPSCCS
jgi:Pyridine nucleotide-disulphide oxidoreductase